MTNTVRGSAAHEVVSRIEISRDHQQRSDAWLSERSGIAYKTLRRRLYGNPDQFTLAELTALARALEVTLEWIVSGEKVAA